MELVTVVAGPLEENRNVLHKSDFVGENIPPISVGLENSEGLVCVRLFLRSAASELDTDGNCELYIAVDPLGENRNILHKSDFVGENGITFHLFHSRIGKLRGPGLCEIIFEISCIRTRY